MSKAPEQHQAQRQERQEGAGFPNMDAAKAALKAREAEEARHRPGKIVQIAMGELNAMPLLIALDDHGRLWGRQFGSQGQSDAPWQPIGPADEG